MGSWKILFKAGGTTIGLVIARLAQIIFDKNLRSLAKCLDIVVVQSAVTGQRL